MGNGDIEIQGGGGSDNIIRGVPTVNSTFFSNIETNFYLKMGKIVAYKLTATAKSEMGYTSELVSGLPPAHEAFRFMGYNAGVGQDTRFAIATDGKMYNNWSSTTPRNNDVIEVYVVYLAEE